MQLQKLVVGVAVITLFAVGRVYAEDTTPTPGHPMHGMDADTNKDGKISREDLTWALPPDDLIVRAARMLQRETQCTLGAHIGISKSIPAQAGHLSAEAFGSIARRAHDGRAPGRAGIALPGCQAPSAARWLPPR